MATIKTFIGNIKGQTGNNGKDGSENQIYSYDETPIGTWVSGETIYRKVVSCGTLPDRTEKKVAHGIKNFGHIINVSGYCEDTNYNYPLPFAYNALNGDGCISVWADKTNITISCPTAYYPDVTASYVILEYTKTT